MLDIISIGECMVEFFCDGPMGRARSFQRAFGGDTLNLLVAAARLGCRCGYITRVGDDPFGPGLLEGWRAEKLDLAHAPLAPGFNGIYFISVLEGGEREFTYYRAGSAASHLGPDDVDPDYIATAKIVHASGITQALSPSCRAAVKRAFEVAKQAGIMTSFDPNLRLKLWTLEQAREALAEVLPLVDVILPAAPQETGELIGIEDPEQAAKHFHDNGVATVVIKMGRRGCLVSDGDTMRRIPAHRSPLVVDTTGAGDAFNGGFLAGLCMGHDAMSGAGVGAAMAGLKVRGRGAVASLPRRAELRKHVPWLGEV
ncbi:MAG: sugar kinase [Armatimonadota bacterium]|nr:MAG: sugar kinase [Armatimonadota bacterium]